MSGAGTGVSRRTVALEHSAAQSRHAHLTYIVEASRGLLDWTIPVTLLGTTPLDAEFDAATYEAASAVSTEARLFFRLRFEPPF